MVMAKVASAAKHRSVLADNLIIIYICSGQYIVLGHAKCNIDFRLCPFLKLFMDTNPSLTCSGVPTITHIHKLVLVKIKLKIKNYFNCKIPLTCMVKSIVFQGSMHLLINLY